MGKKLTKAFNEQIKNEIYSAYLYLSMAAYFERINLDGFSNWMKAQAKEELTHAMKFFEYLNDRGEKVVLQAIPQPPVEFKSPLAVMEETLNHEQKITALINNLYDGALKVNDQASAIFLQWFISEQVEEEKSAQKIINALKMVKPDSAGLLMLDRQLAQRQ